MVLFAMVPALLIAVVSYFLLSQSIDRISLWLSSGSLDRTINSLRIVESRLQDQAALIITDVDRAESQLDWYITSQNNQLTCSDKTAQLPIIIDPTIFSEFKPGQPIRRIINGHLILGWTTALDSEPETIIAGGYILTPEYLTGFSSAAAGLSGSREFQNIIPGYLLFISLVGVVILTIVIISAWLFSRRLSSSVTAPLESLTEFAGQMARNQRPDRIAISGTDEITALATTFNRMAHDLEQSRNRLQAAERVAAWQQFARRLAHELKNPLTPISLSIYRIKNRLQEAGQYEDYADSVEAIASEVEHLKRLASDYSSLAQLPEPKFKKFEFNNLVREIIKLHQVQLEKYKFENMIHTEKLDIVGDPDRLREVIVNLMGNAIDFTPEGKMIILTTARDEHNIYLTLSNEVDQIDDQVLSKAKTPYFTTRAGGTGLGLAISEKIIADHGGSLLIKEEDGLVAVRFDLPLTHCLTSSQPATPNLTEKKTFDDSDN